MGGSAASHWARNIRLAGGPPYMLQIVALRFVTNMSDEFRDRTTQRRRADAGSPPDSRAAAILRLRGRASDAPPPVTTEDAVARVAAAMAAARALERGFWISY
jgi:hypothetical protein